MYSDMESIRCGTCNRLLARGRVVVLEIKCPRCGTINYLRAQSPTPERQERPGDEDA